MKLIQSINPAWFLAGAAFFLPIKPAPVNLFLLLAVIVILLRTEFRQHLVNNFKRRELLPLWFLLVFFLFTYFFQSNNLQSYQDFLTKYGRLLLIPLLACALTQQVDREIVGKGFLAGVALVLLLSYFIWLGIDPGIFGVQATSMTANPENPTVFKGHITHNFFLVIAICWWMNSALSAIHPRERLIYFGFTLAAMVNLFGMIDGRTGWLVFMVLPLYYGFRQYGFKGLLTSGVGFMALLLVAFYTVDNVHDRIAMGLHEMQQLLESTPQRGTSIGERVMYLTASASAFAQAPFFGYGLGGIENAVRPFTSAANWPVFDNPHNQFVMFALQGGVAALVAYIVFYGNLVYQAAINPWAKHSILPILLIYLVGNILNSFHFDFSESVGFVFVVAAYLGSSK